jgi:6-phosphogluconate dehydrogenase
LNIADIAEVWRRGSVITSWLLDLTASAFAEEAAFAAYSGFVQDSGEGRWTIHAAIDEAFNTWVINTMFAKAATGSETPENAFKQAETAMKAIWAKWQDRNLI